MPKYTAIFSEYHQVTVNFTDEFDTSDKDKWEWLKSNAEGHLSDEDFEQLPIKPPKDPKIWFDLYQYVSEMEYGDKEDDWVTVRKGGYDTSRELLDSKGNVIESD